MKNIFKQLALLSVIIVSTSAWSASVIGHWQTIDDKTEKPKSVVELYQKGDKVFGKVVDLLIKPDDTVCKNCKGDLKNQLIIGMNIVTGLSADEESYSGGEILDPENGKTYDAKIWLENDDTLKVRGYLGIFFRTQTWHRVDAPVTVVAETQEDSVPAEALAPTEASAP